MENILKSNSRKWKARGLQEGSMHFVNKAQFVLYDVKKGNVYLDKELKGLGKGYKSDILTECKTIFRLFSFFKMTELDCQSKFCW